MPIIAQCSCGKKLKVDEKHRGKKVKCPACGGVVLVEEAEVDKKTAVQAKAPKKKPAAPRDDADPDEAPDVRTTIKRKTKKADKGSNMTLLLVGGGALLLLACCLPGVGIGAWYFYSGKPDAIAKAKDEKDDKAKEDKDGKGNKDPDPKGGEPVVGPQEDLNLVYDGTVGFVAVRVADVWKNTVVQDIVKQMSFKDKREMGDILKDWETKLGMKIDDLERLTVIVRSFGSGGADKPEVGFVFKTSKPMDRKKIVEAMAKETKEKEREVKHEGGTIYVFGGKDALYFQSDRVVLVCEKEVDVKELLRQAKTPPKHAALTRGIQMASSGKYSIVAAFELKKDVMDKMPADLRKQVPNLKDTTGTIVAGALGKDLALEAYFTYPSAEVATKAKKDVDTYVTLFTVGIKAETTPAPALLKFLESLTVEQRTADVLVKGMLDTDLKGFGNYNPFGAGGGVPARIQNVNNLKHIGLAIHSFHDVNKMLPTHAIRDAKTGQPLLSWRVSLLPYIDQQPLYKQIRLNEPWDSNHNRQFWNKMPVVYQMPGKARTDKTYYQVFQGSESVFPSGTAPSYNFRITMGGIADGTSNTIGVVEAADPVNWMKPDDIPFKLNQAGLMNRVGNHWGDNTFHAQMMDGTVRRFRRNMPQQTLQALITRSGGEIVILPDLEAP